MAKTFDVESSTDGSGWKIEWSDLQVDTKTNIGDFYEIEIDKPVAVRCIRMVNPVRGDGLTTNIQFSEIQFKVLEV